MSMDEADEKVRAKWASRVDQLLANPPPQAIDEHYNKMAELLRHEKQMQSAVWPWPQETTAITTSSSAGAAGQVGPSHWNTGAIPGEAKVSEPDQSEMLWPSDSGRMRSRRPLPNPWVRFWWRFLLGVRWRDLRPENKLDDLRRLG